MWESGMKIPTLYLFESTDRLAFAVGSDMTGCNIPQIAGASGWLLRREVQPDELPADVVLAAYKDGFCLLDDDKIDPGTEFIPDDSKTKR